jgi:hypothetical protein
MRKTRLAVVISSILLGGAFATQAQPAEPTTPSQDTQSQATPQAGSPTTGTAGTDVGSSKSNVDEKSSSGSYYPYSAGTAGDDPSKPKSTSVDADTGDKSDDDTNATRDRWMDADADGDGYLTQVELTKVNPGLAANFASIDNDKDDKLTRDELRVWHESKKASMDADQPAESTSATPATGDAAIEEKATDDAKRDTTGQ